MLFMRMNEIYQNSPPEEVLQIVLRKTANTDKVADVRECFKSVINSKRRLRAITSIEDLVKLLQKRNALDMNAFFTIVQRCEVMDGELQTMFSRYNVPGTRLRCEPTGCVNTNQQYISERMIVEERSAWQHGQIGIQNRNEQRRTSLLPRRVVEHISENILKKWKFFARSLDLKEGYITEIEEKYAGSLQERTYQVLLKFQEKILDTNQVKPKLLQALRKVRREDLVREVETLLLNSNN